MGGIEWRVVNRDEGGEHPAARTIELLRSNAPGRRPVEDLGRDGIPGTDFPHMRQAAHRDVQKARIVLGEVLEHLHERAERQKCADLAERQRETRVARIRVGRDAAIRNSKNLVVEQEVRALGVILGRRNLARLVWRRLAVDAFSFLGHFVILLALGLSRIAYRIS